MGCAGVIAVVNCHYCSFREEQVRPRQPAPFTRMRTTMRVPRLGKCDQDFAVWLNQVFHSPEFGFRFRVVFKTPETDDHIVIVTALSELSEVLVTEIKPNSGLPLTRRKFSRSFEIAWDYVDCVHSHCATFLNHCDSLVPEAESVIQDMLTTDVCVKVW